MLAMGANVHYVMGMIMFWIYQQGHYSSRPLTQLSPAAWKGNIVQWAVKLILWLWKEPRENHN
jgi:hypothetical protein